MSTNTLIAFTVGLLAVVLVMKLIRKLGTASAATLKEQIAAGAVILDVRSPSEFVGGAYPKAKNIPVDQLESKLKQVGPVDKPVIVYCASGMRSSTAAGILKKAGYTQVFNAGGLGSMPR